MAVATDLGAIASGLTALVLLVLFIGICVWTYSGRRVAAFEASARLPLEEDRIERGAAGQAPSASTTRPSTRRLAP